MFKKFHWPLFLMLGTLLTASLACGQTTSETLSDAAKESTLAVQAEHVVEEDTTPLAEAEETAIIPTAVEEPAPVPTEAAVSLQLVEKQGFYQDDTEAVFVFMVSNPNQNLAIESSSYQVAVYDEAGAVLETESGYIEIILPNEQLGVAVTTYLDEGVKAANFEVQLDSGSAEPIDAAPPLFTCDTINFYPDDYFPKVTAVLLNSLARDITDLRVNAVAYDEADNVIGGGFTYVPFIPSSGRTAIEVNVLVPSAPARVELYPTLSGLSLLEAVEESKTKISLVSQDYIQIDSEITAVFFVENPDEAQAVESSQYNAAAYDDAGNVLACDSGYINILMPGERLAYSSNFYVPEGSKAAQIEVQVLSGDPYAVTLSGTPFHTESVQFIPDDYLPKVTGVVKNGLNRSISDMRITAVAYDETGAVIGGGFTFLDFLPASGQAAVEISTNVSGMPVKVELYPTLSSLSDLEDSSAAQILELVDSGVASGTFGTNVVFLIKNTSPDKVLESSQFQVALYDEAGNVLAADSGYISIIFPGEVLAQSITLIVPDGKTPAQLEVQLSDGRTAITELSQNPLAGEQAVFTPDEYFPKVTGKVNNSLDKQISDIEVTAVAYDAEGTIIGGGFTYLDFVPANGSSAVEVGISVSAIPDRVELYPTFSGLTSIGE